MGFFYDNYFPAKPAIIVQFKTSKTHILYDNSIILLNILKNLHSIEIKKAVNFRLLLALLNYISIKTL